MPDGTTVTVDEVMATYKDLHQLWEEDKPQVNADMAACAETGISKVAGGLDAVAEKIYEITSGKDIIILGHSHDDVLKPVPEAFPKMIYANCGTWCTSTVDAANNKPYTFIEVEDNDEDGMIYVSRKRWDPTRPEKKFVIDVLHLDKKKKAKTIG
jgi:predicted phosphodiesterase